MTALPPPNTATDVVQRWNYPKSNIPKLAACFWSFIVMGANDAAYGALIHYIEQFYGLTYLIVSLIFLSPFVGYTVSAFMNNYIHFSVGQRGVAFIAAGCHLVAYLVIALHPPYPVLVIAFMVAGYGNGLADAAWNAFVGNMAQANEILGVLHGFYGLGAVLSPLIATSMITKADTPWYAFYYLMIGFAGLEIASSVAGFWTATAAEYKASLSQNAESSSSSLREALLKKPSARVTWLCAIFLLGYVGIEVALGGWIVVFMIQVRHSEKFASGMTATGFWLGITIGRVILGFVTPRIGEKLAISLYLPAVMALELLFWLVPQFIVSAVAVSLQGFFLGPLFPAAIVAMSKLLPRHLHVGAIGFAAALGSSGAAVLPFAVGAIAQSKGVQVLQPIILALLGAILLVWLGLPKFDKKKE
ncbi:major facilitator superfamily domain-containing protein [Pseudomassariella vexata]|uniref:Major facilitator superfamily domain-containing protein n=1 Tax=Pseudomassariella vexata TaxID=1141098 RepID=A0A1Y2DQU0_9PEZI|nr:major facilitator superfamily domain-containing protein [Pseudomassariella vexata]ORY61539.1 major facilitator superfamily domain-containing protein [Pseudomassariella vexata]